jgi:hypothetical protein
MSAHNWPDPINTAAKTQPPTHAPTLTQRLYRCRIWLRLRLPFLPQLARTTGLVSCVLPFWPVSFTAARLLEPQRLRELVIRPLLPPFMLKTNLLTGASGTASKVLRMPLRQK